MMIGVTINFHIRKTKRHGNSCEALLQVSLRLSIDLEDGVELVEMHFGVPNCYFSFADTTNTTE